MTEHFADRVLSACETHGAPVCVGLDPVLKRLPDALAATARTDPALAIEQFCLGVIEAVARHVPCVKPQLACFERYGSDGWAAYERVVDAAHARGLLVIADAKRGDIGISAAHYAAAFLEGPHGADALTVNAYLGPDTLEPFMDAAQRQGAALFALARTSNPGSDAVQSLKLEDGRSVAEAMADVIAQAGRSQSAYLGQRGYSLLGAVVGATKPADMASLRQRMAEQIFLVPGFGAQGGTAEDARACFHDDGTGAIVTASRSVIYAYEKDTDDARDWREAVAKAAQSLNEQVRRVTRV